MKLNLHVPFKAWNGEEIKERKGEEEKAKMIDETVSLLLFSGLTLCCYFSYVWY